MPFSLIRDFDEIADAPLNRLAAEVSIYKQLKFNSYFFFICTTVSAIGLYQIFTGGPFTETDIDLQTNEEITSDLTSVVRALQTISFQLTLINFLLCVINLFMADRKIRVCFNRVERMQDREDMEVMFNNNLLDNKFKSDFF
ncbi:hypothetical protein C6P42_004279 [Pichia californica]|nr:hypothetical protein C6P42_004279 [[Candida] californica]